MQRFALVIFGICLAFAPFAGADEWSKTYTLTGKPDLRVETSDANIRVDTWDQNTIEARVTTSRYKIGENGIKSTNTRPETAWTSKYASRTSSSSSGRIEWISRSTCRAKET